MAKIHEKGIQDEMFRIFYQCMGNKAAVGCVMKFPDALPTVTPENP